MRLITKVVAMAFALLVAFSPGIPCAPAQERDAAESAPETEQRNQTRQRMLERVGKLRAYEVVAVIEREIERVAEPVFSYSEATRDVGHLGTVWIWGTKGRPAALLSLSKEYERPVWGVELAALTEGVSVVTHNGWRWSPKSALKMNPFADSPPPADSDVRRLSQMKGLVEQFKISEEYFDEPFELRLLPRPIYRYQDAAEGLIDGALFVFAHGTNPEALAVVECRREDKVPVW